MFTAKTFIKLAAAKKEDKKKSPKKDSKPAAKQKPKSKEPPKGMTAKDLLAMADKGNMGAVLSKLKKIDADQEDAPAEKANTRQGLLERINSAKGDSSDREELRVRLKSIYPEEL